MSEAVYRIVTEDIIKSLSQGIVPWRKPWTGQPSVPTSFTTGRPYRGVNRFMLDPCITGFSSPYWITFNQASKQGGKVKAGEKSRKVVFWTWIEKKDKTKFPMLRYSNVWNLQQTEGIAAPDVRNVPANQHEPIVSCQNIIDGWAGRPAINEIEQGRCFYRQSDDTITMQPRGCFEHIEEFYSTTFHELIHSTGHPSRLDRLGRHEYAKEELVAEIGAQFLCEAAGIRNDFIGSNSAAYIADWIKHLNNDHRMVVSAASQAEKAVALITGKQSTEPEPTEE